MSISFTSQASQVESLPLYSDAKKAAKQPAAEEMGQQAFLTLFTTQLQNQNPLDPVKNEAFVAQLAQFSQLESTTKMQASLEQLAAASQSERLLAGAALIGKKVAAPNGSAELKDGAAISGLIAVPDGADRVQLDVFDAQGNKVYSQSSGRQPPGEVSVRWDGYNQAGERMPEGRYQVVATVSSFGQVTQVPISTPSTVTGVIYSATANDLMIEVEGGATVPLSQVARIDN